MQLISVLDLATFSVIILFAVGVILKFVCDEHLEGCCADCWAHTGRLLLACCLGCLVIVSFVTFVVLLVRHPLTICCCNVYTLCSSDLSPVPIRARIHLRSPGAVLFFHFAPCAALKFFAGAQAVFTSDLLTIKEACEGNAAFDEALLLMRLMWGCVGLPVLLGCVAVSQRCYTRTIACPILSMTASPCTICAGLPTDRRHH